MNKPQTSLNTARRPPQIVRQPRQSRKGHGFMIYDTFTAANTEKGFFSYFDELTRDDSLSRVYLIKGGPGSGKSTFMKKIAAKFADDGMTVERIHCSSDPDSLDGVKIKEKNITIIDATAPHAYDMSIPGALESIVDLSKFWDENKLEENRTEIKKLFSEISSSYKPVYSLLKAAGAVDAWQSTRLEGKIDFEKITAQIKKIIKQNAISAVSSKPIVSNRLLSAFSGDGVITYGSTTDTLCSEYIIIEDAAGIANIFLTKAAAYFNKLGYDTLLIHSPLSPDKKLEQVIIPQLRLGFVASGHLYSPEIDDSKVIKAINSKGYIDREFYSENKNKITFARKVIRELTSKAANDISEIKKKHDILERYYIDAMDFKALNKFTDEFIKKL